MWVTGERRVPTQLEPEAIRLQAELDAVECLGHEQTCRICGAPELTEEHSPSKRAGNPQRIIGGSVDYDRTVASGEVQWSMELKQGGATTDTVCGACNNSTGRWYNPAYIRLVNAAIPLAVVANAGTQQEIALDVIHPQRVAKQAVTHLLATSQSGVTDRYPHVRRLLADAEHCETLSPLRLGMYVRVNRGGRRSGITKYLSTESGKGRLLAEFSFWPLGWVLAFDDAPVEGTLDVSDWTMTYGYHEKSALRLAVPCQWARWAYPADFGPAAARVRQVYYDARRGITLPPDELKRWPTRG